MLTRPWRTVPALFALLSGPLIAFGEAADELPIGVEVRAYTGWNESVFLNAADTPVQAVVVPAVGGRVVHFSLDGENILFENFMAQGRTLAQTQEELWLGGYQCDVGPELRALPPHLELTEGRHRWVAGGNFSIKESSQADSNLGAAVEKEFVLAPDTGELGLVQRMRNASQREISYCLWDRTLCKGGGFAFFPLNGKSRFKAGWSRQRQRDGASYYDGERPDAFEAQVLDGVLVVQTTGPVTKLGADSDAGWIAYARGKLLFIKYFPYWPHAHYSDGGNCVELYFDQRATELDPISPEITLAPGHSFIFPEKWVLLPLDKEVTTPEQARQLVRRIPPSPFTKAEPFEDTTAKRR
jgi:hypothetical protein